MKTSVFFDASVFDLTTIKKAAYKFSNIASFEFSQRGKKICCVLVCLDKGKSEQFSHAVETFKNEVLDQDLRQSIACETEAIRNVILSHVFSKTGLQDD